MMYLLNFVLCSGLLLVVYHLFLQNERMYRFNRFYLLFSLMFSLAVPFITIVTKAETLPVAYQQAVGQVFNQQPVVTQEVSNRADNAVPSFVTSRLLMYSTAIGIYVVVAFVLLVRFVINLYRINQRVVKHQVLQHQQTRLVLTDADVTPHSFLKYVFINRNDYNDGTIAPEIICHEQAHVKQLHSVDVMLVEFIQAVCWFNPFIPFYRKAIQLNHEFLADEAVLQSYDDAPTYQHLLVAKANQAHSLQLTSQFNYQTTKKRLIMMTKTTSVKMAWGKKLAIAPVLAAALLLFSNKTSAQLAEIRIEEPVINEVRIDEPLQEIRIDEPVMITKVLPPAATPASQTVLNEFADILKKYNLPFDKAAFGAAKIKMMPEIKNNDIGKLIGLYNKMDKAQRDEQWITFIKPVPPLDRIILKDTEFERFKDATKYGVWIDGKKVNNDKLNEYNGADFDNYFVSKLNGAAKVNKTYSYQVDLMTKAYYAEYVKKAKARANQYYPAFKIPKAYAQKNKVAFAAPIIVSSQSGQDTVPIKRTPPRVKLNGAPGSAAPPRIESVQAPPKVVSLKPKADQVKVSMAPATIKVGQQISKSNQFRVSTVPPKIIIAPAPVN